MMTTAAHYDSSDMPRPAEPGLPYFLDGFRCDSDDLDDWWLDLGTVDLSGVPGM
ncbi:MAG TPA: hypothetical protein VG122_22840 [Gemmata sp.]|jgi:hypothetical protein|nr:hypothetical protein [Gemmata sp.]